MSGAMGGDMLGAGVAGIFNLIGDRWNNAFNASQRKASFEGQVQLQQMQQAWAEKMRATAYQTSVQDMKAAGLNPMLAFSQGPTSTPGGSAGSSPITHAAGPSGLGDAMVRGFGSSAQNELARANATQAASASANQLAQAEQALTQADHNRASTLLTQAQANTETGRPELNRLLGVAAGAQAGQSAASAVREAATTAEINQRVQQGAVGGPPGPIWHPQPLLNFGDRILGGLANGANAVGRVFQTPNAPGASARQRTFGTGR